MIYFKFLAIGNSKVDHEVHGVFDGVADHDRDCDHEPWIMVHSDISGAGLI
jgi:hypothetical protein